jgi:hypothetical protein
VIGLRHLATNTLQYCYRSEISNEDLINLQTPKSIRKYPVIIIVTIILLIFSNYLVRNVLFKIIILLFFLLYRSIF